MNKDLDAQLIRNFIAGDVHSFNRLVQRWNGRLYRFAYRYMADEEDAKDVVQAALIKAYKNMEKLKNPEKFSSWIFQITVNLCKDALKSGHKTRVALERDMAGGDADSPVRLDDMEDDNGGRDEYHTSDLGDLVRRTLAQIPDEQRIVIIMKEYDGFKFSEIAEILNCPLNTVKARMYYGLRHMQKILNKLDIDREVLFNER